MRAVIKKVDPYTHELLLNVMATHTYSHVHTILDPGQVPVDNLIRLHINDNVLT